MIFLICCILIGSICVSHNLAQVITGIEETNKLLLKIYKKLNEGVKNE